MTGVVGSGAELVAFVATTDLAGAERFYGDLLGLAHVETTPYAAVFRCGPTTLRVTLVERADPAGYTVLGWTVPDLAAGVAALVAAGVPTLLFAGMEQDDAGIWTTPDGARVAWFHDPDGNTLSLTQPAPNPHTVR